MKYFLLITMFFAQVVFAQNEFVDGFYSFKTNNDGNSVTVIDYHGNEDIVVIPSKVKHNGNEYIVRYVGDNVFGSKDCSVVYIHFPDSLISIGNKVAYEMPSLAYINTGNGLTEIGDSCFCNCDFFSGASFGKSVASVGQGSFCYTKNNGVVPVFNKRPSMIDSQIFKGAFQGKFLPKFKEADITKTLFYKSSFWIPQEYRDAYFTNGNKWSLHETYFHPYCLLNVRPVPAADLAASTVNYKDEASYIVLGDTLIIRRGRKSQDRDFPFDMGNKSYLTQIYIKTCGEHGAACVRSGSPTGFNASLLVFGESDNDSSDGKSYLYAFNANEVKRRLLIATGDPSKYTGVDEVTSEGQITETTYYDITGRISSTPHHGVNIVVKKYDNGKSKVSKEIFP